jgi:hypothetical protein
MAPSLAWLLKFAATHSDMNRKNIGSDHVGRNNGKKIHLALLRRTPPYGVLSLSIHIGEILHLYVVSENTGHVIVYTVTGTSTAVKDALIYNSSDKEHCHLICNVLQSAIYTNILK